MDGYESFRESLRRRGMLARTTATSSACSSADYLKQMLEADGQPGLDAPNEDQDQDEENDPQQNPQRYQKRSHSPINTLC